METLSIVPIDTDVDPCSSRVPPSTTSLRRSYVPRKYLILTRLGADVLVGRINRMWDEERTKVAMLDSRSARARSGLHADIRPQDGDLVRLGLRRLLEGE